ncbi:MAG: hypothetical protein AABZ24_10650, partial [Nitrospirota bacterium]
GEARLPLSTLSEFPEPPLSLPENYGFLDIASLFGQFVFEEFHDIHHLLVSLADQLACGSVAES